MANRYNTPEEGNTDWHIPLNENFEALDRDVEIRDLDANRDEYDPKQGTKFVSTDTHDVYLGDGTSWEHIGKYGETSANGVGEKTIHVGPFHDGEWHDSTAGDGSFGVVMWLDEDVEILSAVVASDVDEPTDLPVELREYNDGAEKPPVVDNTVVTVSGGVERIDLNLNVPDTGEYVLCRGAQDDPVPLRRIGEYTNWDDHSRDAIELRQGTNAGVDGDYGSEEYYYYFFDIAFRDGTNGVMAPWSTDVGEIYMRPHPPEEEFGDDVSPRALWFDTS